MATLPTLEDWDSNETNGAAIPSQIQTDGVPNNGGILTTYVNRMFSRLVQYVKTFATAGANLFDAEHKPGDGTHTDITADSVSLKSPVARVPAFAYRSAADAAVTNGSTSEQTVATLATFPATTFTANNLVRVRWVMSGTNAFNGGLVTARVKLGTTTSDSFSWTVDSAQHIIETDIMINSVGSPGNTRFHSKEWNNTPTLVNASYNVGTLDTAASQDLTVSLQFGTAGGGNSVTTRMLTAEIVL